MGMWREIRNAELAGQLQARLGIALAEEADPSRMADLTAALWVDIAAALVPIIGMQGMTALLRRSLSVSVVDSPSLAAALSCADSAASNGFDALRCALLTQSSAGVLKSNTVLLENFLKLLATLIGASLTERLLKQVPDIAPSERPRQERTP